MGLPDVVRQDFGFANVKHNFEVHGWEIDVTTGTNSGTRFEVSGT